MKLLALIFCHMLISMLHMDVSAKTVPEDEVEEDDDISDEGET